MLSVGPVAISLAGFTVNTGSITLSNTGLAVSNAQVSLPASLPPGGTPPTLTGNLTIAPDFTVVGSLTTGPFGISVAGFTVSADGITLSTGTGLVVSNAHLALPASLFPAGSTPPTLTGNLTISPSFAVNATLMSGPFSLSVAGFTVSADGISLTNANGLVVSNARLTLPASFLPAGSSPVTLVGNLSVDPKFNVTASLSTTNVTIAYAGVALHVDSIVLNNSGLAVTNATVTLPSDLGGGTLVGNLTVSSSFAIAGSLALQHPSFTFHGFTVSADSISLSVGMTSTAGVTPTTGAVFQISNVSVALPSDLGEPPLVGNLTATFGGSGGTRIMGQLSTATNASFTFDGFTVKVGAITLDNNGVRVSGASLTLPDQFNVDGQPVVLTGALGLDVSGGHTTFTGSLGARNIRIGVFGFTLTVGNITVGTDGFAVQDATLMLPSALATLVKTSSVSLASLTISRDFKVSARLNPLSFSLAGASVSTNGQTDLSSDGIATSASVTLPPALGGQTFDVPNLTIGSSGDTSGAASGKPYSFSVGGLTLSASGFGFKNGGIFIDQVSASLPIIQGSFALSGVSFDGHHVGIQGGTASLALPPISAGGFSISAQATLTFSSDSSGFRFDLVGSGMIAIPSLGQFHCALEVGTTDANHPSVLRMAELDVQLKVGIPLGPSGLELNAISGGIRIGRNTSTGGALVTLQLGLGIATDDSGYLFQGNIKGAFATDGNFGLGGSAAFLANLIQISGGFCARFSAQNDGVCGAVLRTNGAKIDASGGTGFYAEVTLGRSFHVRGDITIQGSAYAHIWKDSDGAELSASIGAHIDVPSGSLFVLIPPKDLHFDAGATLGKFRGGSQTYRGIKFAITYHIETFFHNFNGSYSAFIDDSGHVHLDADNYTLIDAGNNVGYLLANLPDGSALARRVPARLLAAPLHSRELQTTLRILPGQRDGVFILYWRHGATAPRASPWSRPTARATRRATPACPRSWSAPVTRATAIAARRPSSRRPSSRARGRCASTTCMATRATS